MQDQKKTKVQLIEELEQLRARLADLEKQWAPVDRPVQRRAQRNELATTIHFVGDFGLLQAQGVDLSENGVCFETAEEIPFDMEFEYQGKLHQHRAQLVWMRLLPNGRSRFGFRFVSSETSDLLWLYQELDDLPE
jgi:hypothetical protein